MESHHFDRLTVSLSMRFSRRRALTAGVAGLVAAGLARGGPAVAQDATPTASTSTPTTVYIQLADGGSWVPKPDADDVYLLTLIDPGEQTLSFTLAPDRYVTTIPTEDLLETLGFTPDNPPNAAIEVVTASGERDVLVVQLMDPVYTVAADGNLGALLIYEARVLDAYRGTGLQEWTPEVDDDQLPTEFERVSLFIDNGCWGFTGCFLVEDGVRGARIGAVPSSTNLMRCPGFEPGTCVPCSGNSTETFHARCNSYYSECNNRCIAD